MQKSVTQIIYLWPLPSDQHKPPQKMHKKFQAAVFIQYVTVLDLSIILPDLLAFDNWQVHLSKIALIYMHHVQKKVLID